MNDFDDEPIDKYSSYFTSSSPSDFSYSRKSRNLEIREFSETFSESQSFHDPFSPLYLFLAKKIRQFIDLNESDERWNTKVQEKIINHLSKDLATVFPKYRINLNLVKKIWDKIHYLLSHIKQQEEALNEDGSVNIDFLLSENLKQTLTSNTSFPSHPFYFAHQVALQIAECIAVLEGRKIAVDKLAKKVAHIHKHLTSRSKNQKLLYSEVDKLDKLIIKNILEITAKEPLISYYDLKNKTKESLLSLKKLPLLSSHDEIHTAVSSLLSEKMSLLSPLYSNFSDEEKSASEKFIKEHYKKIKESQPAATREDIIRRILSLYRLATQIPKNIDEITLQEAILACYPNYSGIKPDLPQALYAFIAAEIVLMENENYCLAQTLSSCFIQNTYRLISNLRLISIEDYSELEIFICKWISEEENTLNKIFARISKKIEQEIVSAIIDHPNSKFSEMVASTSLIFRSYYEITQKVKEEELLQRIDDWSMQSDLLLKYIELDSTSNLLSEIDKSLTKRIHSISLFSHVQFVSEMTKEYLQKHPELETYSPQLSARIWTMYKYLWYTKLAKEDESGFETFLRWHEFHLKSLCQELSEEQLQEELIGICQKRLPCIPYSFVCDWCKPRLSKNKPNT